MDVDLLNDLSNDPNRHEIQTVLAVTNKKPKKEKKRSMPISGSVQLRLGNPCFVSLLLFIRHPTLLDGAKLFPIPQGNHSEPRSSIL
jgi:hypothetical protein